MEIVILAVLGLIVYLLVDNRRVAEELPAVTVTERVNKASGLGVGWLIIIMLALWLLLGSAVGFANLNVGVTPEGVVTLTEPHDPNNPIARPVGEILGYRQDAGGHWTR